MDWVQFIILIISMSGMFSWLKSDIAINRTEAAADRRDILTLIRSIQDETNANLKAIQDEMKDFHGRLCAIEERKKIKRGLR
jgi:hypothetical protein